MLVSGSVITITNTRQQVEFGLIIHSPTIPAAAVEDWFPPGWAGFHSTKQWDIQILFCEFTDDDLDPPKKNNSQQLLWSVFYSLRTHWSKAGAPVIALVMSILQTWQKNKGGIVAIEFNIIFHGNSREYEFLSTTQKLRVWYDYLPTSPTWATSLNLDPTK